MWWEAVKVALGVGAGVTSFVWGVAVYRAGEAGLRVSAMTNQLALASICQVNNGTLADALCGSYLAAFNKNFAAVSSAVAHGDGSASIDLFPSDSAHALPITIILVITFLCTTAGVYVVVQVADRARRRRETRKTVEELDEMTRDTSLAEGKAPGIVDVKGVRR